VPPDPLVPCIFTNTTTVNPGNFNTTGMRLPMVVISPWVKAHYVSYVVRDYTAISKLIETRLNLPPLTACDVAQDDMTEMFDFTTPSLLPPNVANPADDRNV
jgi:phospholipase C